MKTKHIFVTGGVVSGLGKGITAASLGLLLKSRGYRVTLQKLDPYLNIDPRQMSPIEHGEVFVTADGQETDLDIGHYERFLDEDMSCLSNVTSGQVYDSVIRKERAGVFGGETVQVIPHITNEIMANIFDAGSSDCDFVITEIGGTVGDIEALPFFETIRQVANRIGRQNVLYIHVTLIPYIASSGEMKTKPTQHSVKELLSIGIQPDIIVCRTDRPLNKELRDKIALFCNVERDAVIENRDTSSIYEVPLLLEDEKFAELVLGKLNMKNTLPDLTNWKAFVAKQHETHHKVSVAIVGEYVEMPDAYLSVVEALNVSGLLLHTEISIDWVAVQELEEMSYGEAKERLKGNEGIILSGNLSPAYKKAYDYAIEYAKQSKKPFIASCYGYEMVIENLVGKEAIRPVTRAVTDGIRMGARQVVLKDDTLVSGLYNKEETQERFWHAYEINPEFYPIMEEKGIELVGFSKEFVEMIELNKDIHPFFIATQFEPAYSARPNKPHPLFQGFVEAMQGVEIEK